MPCVIRRRAVSEKSGHDRWVPEPTDDLRRQAVLLAYQGEQMSTITALLGASEAQVQEWIVAETLASSFPPSWQLRTYQRLSRRFKRYPTCHTLRAKGAPGTALSRADHPNLDGRRRTAGAVRCQLPGLLVFIGIPALAIGTGARLSALWR